MQILKLCSLESIIKGGSSKPILITAFDERGVEKPYVMKTYTKKFVKQNFSVAKEILITELAKEFDLPVPNYGLIKIDNECLYPLYNETQIAEIDDGYKFCSEYREGYAIMKPHVSSKFLKHYDFENLFAFDNLIINTDRGGFRNKPNLLINDENMLLIDHEQTLPFINSFEHNEVNYYSQFNNFYYKNHLFWPTLKKLTNNKKGIVFEEFTEMLRLINIERFKLIFDNMDNHDIEYGDKNIIFAYLYWARTNYNHINKVLIDRLNER